MSSTLFLLLQFYILLHTSHSSNLHPPPTTPTCHNACGTIPIKYPFGTEFGCGHPAFAPFVNCNAGMLQLTTSTGSYPISSIDYDTNSLIVTDPLMSNCTSMQNSGSFGLDPYTPFTLTTASTFVLLGCSTTSPVFDSSQDLCDTGSGLRMCKELYSCKGVTGIGLQPDAAASTCCVYTPPSGSGYMLDLPKLQCSSYTCVSGYGEDEGDPKIWKYGVSLEFNSSYGGEDGCKVCEVSGGTCGFMGLQRSFACICQNGINTTSTCYGQGYSWSEAWRWDIYSKLTVQGLIFLWISIIVCARG